VLSETAFSGACRILRVCRFWRFLSSLRASIASWRWKIAFEESFADGRFFAETTACSTGCVRAGFGLFGRPMFSFSLFCKAATRYLVSPVVIFA
jgi:hypothetical protein